MPHPPEYNPSTNFGTQPSSVPNPGKLDVEFANIAQIANLLRNNARLIQRDDGKLADGAVRLESLDATVAASIVGGWTPRGAWTADTAYKAKDYVSVDGLGYVATSSFTSFGDFATDKAAGRWMSGFTLSVLQAKPIRKNFVGDGNQVIFSLDNVIEQDDVVLVFVDDKLVDNYTQDTGTFQIVFDAAPPAPAVPLEKNVVTLHFRVVGNNAVDAIFDARDTATAQAVIATTQAGASAASAAAAGVQAADAGVQAATAGAERRRVGETALYYFKNWTAAASGAPEAAADAPSADFKTDAGGPYAEMDGTDRISPKKAFRLVDARNLEIVVDIQTGADGASTPEFEIVFDVFDSAWALVGSRASAALPLAVAGGRTTFVLAASTPGAVVPAAALLDFAGGEWVRPRVRVNPGATNGVFKLYSLFVEDVTGRVLAAAEAAAALASKNAAVTAQEASEAAAAATVGLVSQATTAKNAAETAAGQADAARDDTYGVAATVSVAAGIAIGAVFLPNFIAKSRTTDAQPAGVNGDTYILTAGRSGAQWGGWNEFDVVRYTDAAGAWIRIAPVEGAECWVEDTNEKARFENGAWGPVSASQIEDIASFAALKALTTVTLAPPKTVIWLRAWHNGRRDGGGEFDVIRSSAAAAGLTADDVVVIENTAQTLTFVRRRAVLGVEMKGMGAKPGLALIQADYENNDAAIARWRASQEPLALVDGQIGFWTPFAAADAFKLRGKGGFMPVVVAGDPQTPQRAGASLFSYKGPATADAAVWIAHSAEGVEPTGADVNPEGFNIKDVGFDGGNADVTFAAVRLGYGNVMSDVTFVGGQESCVVLQGCYGSSFRNINISEGPGRGLVIGENYYDFVNDRYCFDISMNARIAYRGYSGGVKVVPYTVVRATLNAPDGSESEDNATETRQYLVGTAGSGAFAGHNNKRAFFNPQGVADNLGRPSGWSFEVPAVDDIIYDGSSHNAKVWNGATWDVDNTKIDAGAGLVYVSMRQGDDFVVNTIERCAGFGAVIGSRANFGPSTVRLSYLERNAGGVLIAYENNSRGLKVDVAFPNPGSGHPEQVIVVRGQSSVAGHTSNWLRGAAPLADAGPSDPEHYLVIEGFHGRNDANSDGVTIISDTGKFYVNARDKKVLYPQKVPANYADKTQNTLYVDFAAGHDSFIGTAAKPLKSLVEAARRCLRNGLAGPQTTFTINLAGVSNVAQTFDCTGIFATEVVIDLGGAAQLTQNAVATNIALYVKGKGPRVRVINGPANGLYRTLVEGADVEIDVPMTQTATALAAHYALTVSKGARVKTTNTINGGGVRGVKVDNGEYVPIGTVVSNCEAGLYLVCDNDAQIRTKYASTDGNASWLIAPNASTGGTREGYCFFANGVYPYATGVLVAGGLQQTSHDFTITVVSAGGGSVNTGQTCRVRRIGDVVTLSMPNATLTGVVSGAFSAGALSITGFTEDILAGAGEAQGFPLKIFAGPAAVAHCWGRIINGGTSIGLYKDTVGNTTLNASDLHASTALYLLGSASIIVAP